VANLHFQLSWYNQITLLPPPTQHHSFFRNFHHLLIKMFLIVFPVINIYLNALVIQIPVLVMVPPPMRSYFHSATKKVLDHLRATWRDHHMQFTSTQVMVQHLVEGMTSVFITMPTVTLTPTLTLVNATLTLFQAEYKTSTQSWLGLVTSHLMRWRCFISLTNIPTFSFSTQADQKESLF